MKNQKENRCKRLTIRFTTVEYGKLNKSYEPTLKRGLANYARTVLLERPVVVLKRNQSLDKLITELMLVRRELSAIGNNFNQLVKRLHTAEQINEIKHLLKSSEEARYNFLEKTENISQKISEITTEWLRE